MLRDVQEVPEIQAMLSEAFQWMLPFARRSMEPSAQARRLLGFDLLQATRVTRADVRSSNCCDA